MLENFDFYSFFNDLYLYIIFNITFSGFIIDGVGVESPILFGGIEYSISIYLFYFGLICLGRLIYKKLKLKKESYGNIYLLSFIGIIFPIISIFSAILLGMRKEKLSIVIKIFSIGFVVYSLVGFILYKYFYLTWGNVYGYFFS